MSTRVTKIEEDVNIPVVGSCRPVFETDEECRKFFNDFREFIREDIKMFEDSRRPRWCD
jgi:hypothetical protein